MIFFINVLNLFASVIAIGSFLGIVTNFQPTESPLSSTTFWVMLLVSIFIIALSTYFKKKVTGKTVTTSNTTKSQSQIGGSGNTQNMN